MSDSPSIGSIALAAFSLVPAATLLGPALRRPVLADPRRRLVYARDYQTRDVLVLDENLNEETPWQTHGALRNLQLSEDGDLHCTACLGGICAIGLKRALNDARCAPDESTGLRSRHGCRDE